MDFVSFCLILSAVYVANHIPKSVSILVAAILLFTAILYLGLQ